MASDGTDLAEAMLGLPGFLVLEVVEGPDELVITIGTSTEDPCPHEGLR